jgi:Fe-S-cluster containining protein
LQLKVEIRPSFEDISFKCQRCGACCHHRRPEEFGDLVAQDQLKEFWKKSNLIYLSEKDIDNISRRTRLDPSAFVDTLYDEKRGSVKIAEDGAKVILDLPVFQRKDDSTCVFFGEKGCEIYSLRPVACRLFPFRVEEDTAPDGSIILRIGYNESCPGIGKGKSVDIKKLEKLVLKQFSERVEAVVPKVQRLRIAGKIKSDAEIYRTVPRGQK